MWLVWSLLFGRCGAALSCRKGCLYHVQRQHCLDSSVSFLGCTALRVSRVVSGGNELHELLLEMQVVLTASAS